MKKLLCLAIAFTVCLGSTACSSNTEKSQDLETYQSSSESTAKPTDSRKDEVVVNPTKDKISLLLTAKDESLAGGEKFSFKAKNESDDTFLLEDILILAYDKDLNFLKVSDENKAVELAPGEKSKKFNYWVDGDVEFVKIVGYRYTQNGTTFIDTFASIDMSRNSSFIGDANYYSDEEILNKAYEK